MEKEDVGDVEYGQHEGKADEPEHVIDLKKGNVTIDALLCHPSISLPLLHALSVLVAVFCHLRLNFPQSSAPCPYASSR